MIVVFPKPWSPNYAVGGGLLFAAIVLDMKGRASASSAPESRGGLKDLKESDGEGENVPLRQLDGGSGTKSPPESR